MLIGARVLGCLIGIAASSGAFANESVYRNLAIDADDKVNCLDLAPISKKDRDAMVDQGQDIPWSVYCKGYKGYRILDKWDRRESVQFGYLSDRVLKHYVENLDADNSAGGKVEWRLDDKGTPRAAILRYKLVNYNFDEKPFPDILVISKVGQPDSQMGCAIGMVDTSANKNANELARQVADTVEPGFECGQDEPQYHGKRSKNAPNLACWWNDSDD